MVGLGTDYSVSPSANRGQLCAATVSSDQNCPPPYEEQEETMVDSRVAGATSSTRPIDDPDEVVIAVMGATGTGKTTFINTVSGSELEISGGLFSCTNAIGSAPPFSLDGRNVTLIDTPGFDDTMRSDTDILKMIALYLTHAYERGRKLAGVIYIHRISDMRMGGTSTRNFSMFRKLCGESTLKNVVVMTNMWGEVREEVGSRREQELASEDLFFKGVLDKGARMLRHDGSQASAQAVLRCFLDNMPTALQIQYEIVEEHKDILQTAAGAELNRVLIEQKERYEREMTELQQEHREALDAREEETRLEIEAATEELRENMARIGEESRNLAANFQEENERFRQRMEEMESLAKQELERIEHTHRAEMDEIRQQRQADAEHAAAREAALRKEIEATKKRRTSFWDVLTGVLAVATGGGVAMSLDDGRVSTGWSAGRRW